MLKQFGETVLHYFLSNFSEGSEFKLSVDDYTFSNCAQRAGLDEDAIIKKLRQKETNYCGEFEALAIAFYQVKIAGDIDSITNSKSDAYYQKIRDNYPQYTDKENQFIMKKYFVCCQEDLWKCVEALLKKNERTLIIPKERTGSGRYVQYPVNAKELTNTELLKWADKFRSRELKSNQVHITYKVFCDLFFVRSRYYSESFKRTIFNFYGIWDGRSYKEIISKTHIAHSDNRNQNLHSDILLEIDSDTFVFYDKDTGAKVSDVKQIEKLCYSSFRKMYFRQNGSCFLYESKKDIIEENSEFVLLSSEELQFEAHILSFKPLKKNIEQRTFFAYGLTATKDMCVRLKLDPIDLSPVKFVGGLKTRSGHYFSFALPTIEFSETQNIVYINATPVKLESNRMYLNTLKDMDFKQGIYTIKAPDYIPIKIEIDELESENERMPDAIGWLFTEGMSTPVRVSAEDMKNRKIIQGFCADCNFTENIQQTTDILNTRKFLVLKCKRENRFLGNKLINTKKRGSYE